MEEKQFRGKVRWFTFLFSVLVVWVHAFNAELFLGSGPSAAGLKRVQTWIGNGLGQFAVPGFFMISGYLFYRGFTWDKLGRKWRSRFRSLVVPYFLWNGLYYLGYVTASRVSGLADIVGKGRIPFGRGGPLPVQCGVLVSLSADLADRPDTINLCFSKEEENGCPVVGRRRSLRVVSGGFSLCQ